jgi:hypothetical protein
MSAYIISGPTQIGDSGQLNEIIGTLRLDYLNSVGAMTYSNTINGDMVALPIGATGDVLRVVGGIPQWSNFTTTETGFSARVATFTAPLPAPFTELTVGNGPSQAGVTWSTSTAPEFDTTGGAFSTTTGVYTAPNSGTVNAQTSISLLSSNNAGQRSLSLIVNKAGTPQRYTMVAQPSADKNIPLVLHAAAQLSLAATDTLEVVISSTAGAGNSSVQTGAASWFSLSKNYSP